MASKFETPVAMDEDCSMSEAEDGELIDDIADAPPLIQNKLQLRAKRFGIVPNDSIRIAHPDKRINKLYSSMGVDSKTRLEALHMFGIDNMKTQDVFAYFETTPPVSVEWISDKTCNAVWLDEKACALALLACSIRIKGHNVGDSHKIETDPSSDEDEEYIRVEDLRLALPPGVWRKGFSRQFAPNIFLRFATKFDRENGNDRMLLYPYDFPVKTMVFPDEGDEKLTKFRPESDNPWSDIARQWGHFEQRVCDDPGPREKVSLRDAREMIKKRDVREPVLPARDAREILSAENKFTGEHEMRNDRLFGKMHADIEERKMLQRKIVKRPRKNLGEIDLRQRLGNKRSRYSNGITKQRSVSSDEEDLRIEVDNVKERLGEGAWVSYESGESSDESNKGENESNSADLRQKLKGNSKPFLPRSPLRIEIDNDIYYSGNASDSSST